MTLPYERTRAVLETRKFLLALMDPKSTRRVPLHIRKQARALLKHYPNGIDISLVALRSRDVFAGAFETYVGPVEAP